MKSSIKQMAWRALCLAACAAVSGQALAEGLPGLILDASVRDPAVLEARARHEQAQMQTEHTRSAHWPVIGVATTQKLAGNDPSSSRFTGVTARLNVFSAGAISAQVRRDEARAKYFGEKTDETRENIATTVAESYLAALRNSELLEVERANLKRHEKIIGDLKIIVKHDQGRLYELVQAESRALQVRMRMVQYEKAMRLALNKITRYTELPVTLGDPFGKDWRKLVDVSAARSRHPSIQAQLAEAAAVRADLESAKRSRWPTVDVVGQAGNTRGYGATQSVNLVLNWNFFDRGGYYNQAAVGKQLAAAESRVDLLNREIAERSHTAETDMAQSELQAAAARQQIASSEKVVELYEMQFRIARRSLLDVLNAYQELASVHASEAVANNDYRQAVMTYLVANSALVGWSHAAPAQGGRKVAAGEPVAAGKAALTGKGAPAAGKAAPAGKAARKAAAAEAARLAARDWEPVP